VDIYGSVRTYPVSYGTAEIRPHAHNRSYRERTRSGRSGSSGWGIALKLRDDQDIARPQDRVVALAVDHLVVVDRDPVLLVAFRADHDEPIP
jgi:hypothetical protein